MNFKYPLTWRRVLRLSATFLIALFLFISCKKKDSNLGVNMLDPNDLLNSKQIDTFSLQTFTIKEDSVITKNPSFALLGSYNDPKFGVFDANFYTQLRLSGLNPNFGVDPIVIDSLVLGLEYVSYYGDFTDQTLEVYELTESLHKDSTYYAFDTMTHSATNLVEPGFETFTPNPSGITVIGSDTVETQLRIRLKNSLAQQFIDEASSAGTNFASNENFLEYFKGLHIKVNNGTQTSGKGGVFYFNLNDPLSKMTIYYTQNSIQKTFDFLINSECVDFNHVDVDNTGKHVQTVIDDPVNGQTQYYAQAFNSRAVVSIPGLANIPAKTIIHKAQLVLPIQYQTGAKYEPSYDLFVSIETENGLSGIGVVAVYDPYNKQYTVDLKSYLQALTSGQISATELILSPRFFISSAERVIFNGPETANKKKPQLLITYTEY